ncbi:actin-like ATPase domain-containing protein [Xylaria bambusicola]|uniref:actin-like ATPase domain-containing protein n=1 Tax=Xylaria bambusicola TaxID=326684 RepID=UPI0020086B76|nr:actin-like ATPase domain-containing protein [Xylaria bambusicola]KAI0514769.1 actin-like ATPase domain-containing protein [Xylaria bambusicola]
MSSQQGKWREDQVLVICPGSQTTMAQLGCSELTPPAHRIPTRMFKDEEGDEYLPHRTYKRKKSVKMDKAETIEKTDKMEPTASADSANEEDGWEYVEDRDSVEGAIYPIQGGRIVNMPAFLAFLDHVHGLLTSSSMYHITPIVLMASPQWTRPDCEAIARYIFEKTKTPSLCLLHSAVASQYGLKWPTMTVVDIGFEKVDVTCIYDSNIVSHKDLGFPSPVREISGGEVFTQKLLSLLRDKGFTYEMAEQLKKSSICEVLPYAPELAELMELPTESQVPPSQGAAPAPASVEPPKIMEPIKPVFNTDTDTENGDPKEADEGVLDVANIVTSGNTREFLAKREKEKAEKAKTKKQGKGLEPESTAAKPVRLPNSKRKTNIFHYEDLEHEDVQVPVSSNGVKPPPAVAVGTEAPVATENGSTNEQIKPEGNSAEESQTNGDSSTEPVKTVTERRTKRVRKDIEVGLERFYFADRGEINRITDTIYHAVQSIDDIYKRSACWDNIVFVGNGSRLRGLKENVMQTLTSRHLISPSTATIFTSELPSNMATPSGTGSQTPTGSFTGQIPTTSSVNPLLQAATTASLGVPGQAHAPSSNAGDSTSHHSHGQTPMSIKQATQPTYLADWTKNGFEEAMFLGSLVAARLAYCIHNLDAATTESQRYMSLNRVDYNENGPKAIRTHSMLGS